MMDIRLINISKSYKSSEGNYIDAIQMINMDINEQSYITIVGPSGSGKSTLLNIVSGNLKPSLGDVYWGRNALWGASSKAKTPDRLISRYRRERFGIVFQDNRFVPELTVEENVLLPLVINAIDINKKLKYYNTLMEKLKITKLRHRLREQLSGGEKRKVQIARALINSPEFLIADEPTSHLDDDSAREVFSIFYHLNELGLTVVVATHDDRFSQYAKETYYLEKGLVVDFKSRTNEKVVKK